ncbi:MAG: hypothetical protein JWO85_2472 [Candidatus Eremiobacteraeota bacterium]|nr:hypothetical protein [Candidatus Eremiobacteraeota bacterium]
MKVPFPFRLTEPEYYRSESGDDPALRRMYYQGDLPGGLRAEEMVGFTQRLVFAMLSPLMPACDIDRMVPDGKGARPYSPDDVFTLYHCITRQQIQTQWRDKLKRGGMNRYAVLERVELPDATVVELAVSWRRLQQFSARDLAGFTRIASPLDDVAEAPGTPALTLLLSAFNDYLAEGVPNLAATKPVTGHAVVDGL